MKFPLNSTLHTTQYTSDEILHHLPHHCPADVGMGTPVQQLSFLWITEHKRGKFGSVDAPVLMKNLSAKFLHYQFPSRFARFHH